MSHEQALQWIIDLASDEDFLGNYQRELLRPEATKAKRALAQLKRQCVA